MILGTLIGAPAPPAPHGLGNGDPSSGGDASVAVTAAEQKIAELADLRDRLSAQAR